MKGCIRKTGSFGNGIFQVLYKLLYTANYEFLPIYYMGS